VRAGSLRAHQFQEQLANLILCRCQCLTATWSRKVDFASRFALASFRRSNVALSFQAVKNRVKRARTDPVPVAGEFLNHAEAEDGRLVDGVMKDVQADEARVEITVVACGHFKKAKSATGSRSTTAAQSRPARKGSGKRRQREAALRAFNPTLDGSFR
jgi:hypothetical protein